MELAFQKILNEYNKLTEQMSSGGLLTWPNWGGGNRRWRLWWTESGIMN